MRPGRQRGVLAPVATTRTRVDADQRRAAGRVRYLAEVAETVRAYHAGTAEQVAQVRRARPADRGRRPAVAGSPTAELDALIPAAGPAVDRELAAELAALTADADDAEPVDRQR